MTVLAIDTSTDVASLALWQRGQIIWTRELSSKKTHSSALFPALEEVRDIAGKIDRIAVGLGPGSYAGVRIAIAAVLGLQIVWDCEVVGLPSVLGLGGVHDSFRVIGDARRGSWYYSEVLNGVCVDGPRLLDSAADLTETLASSQSLIVSTDELSSDWKSERRLPDARILAQLAALDLGIIQRDDLEPLYLREPHITPANPTKVG